LDNWAVLEKKKAGDGGKEKYDKTDEEYIVHEARQRTCALPFLPGTWLGKSVDAGAEMATGEA
jgi:hypothetical protein